jgi:hypothetical protein
MDALKLIPQLFYDLISRVLPGSVAIILLSASTDLKLGKVTTDFWVGATAIQESAWLLGFGFIVAGYLVGQIISPISDFIEQNLVKRLFPSYYQVLQIGLSDKGTYSPNMRNVLLKELGVEKDDDGSQITSGQYQKAVFVWYDWLRVNSQEAGANAAKIRAEYRMHSQNTVVFFLAVITHSIWAYAQQGQLNLAFIIVIVIAGLLSLWATARVYRTFQWAVIQQFYAAKMSAKIQTNKS